MSEQPTEIARYIDLARLFHEKHDLWEGRSCRKHWQQLVALSRAHGCASALDYGCGKGLQYAMDFDGLTLEGHLGYTVAKYDPAVPAFATEPDGRFDLVWSIDVLEHIPESGIAWVLDRIFGLAAKAVYLVIATQPSRKRLSNGENVHVTVKPEPWWREKIDASASLAGFAGDLACRFE